MLKKMIIVIIVCYSFSLSFAEESVDLNQLTTECIDAANKHSAIRKDFPYKVLHTVQYEGWSGISNTFKLVHPVKMTIKYAGLAKTGYYWFQNDPQTKYDVTAKSDSAGNFELIENIGSHFINYTFRGLMKDGVIKGLWEKGDGKKAYAFYVKAIEEQNTQPKNSADAKSLAAD